MSVHVIHLQKPLNGFRWNLVLRGLF